MRMTKPVLTMLVAALLLPAVCQGSERDEPDADVVGRFVVSHCVDCHDDFSETAGLSLEDLNASSVAMGSLP